MSETASRAVIGYDGSPDGDHALDWAADYAGKRGLRLEVIACVGDLELIHERAHQDGERLAKQWLEQAESRLAASGRAGWTTTTSPERSVPALLEASRDAALVVVGARGHSKLGGLVLGSVSQHVTRHADCPVVVVRPPATAEARRVVVGVDGSESSLRAAAFAFDVAQADGATVVALYAHREKIVNGPWDASIAPDVAADMEEATRFLEEALAKACHEHPDVPVELTPMPESAVTALSDASATASLVVVGTRGHGGFAGLLLGSTSATVLHHAHCPVAVVR